MTIGAKVTIIFLLAMNAGDNSTRHRYARQPSLRLRQKAGCFFLVVILNKVKDLVSAIRFFATLRMTNLIYPLSPLRKRMWFSAAETG
jgi:hypothetical protein